MKIIKPVNLRDINRKRIRKFRSHSILALALMSRHMKRTCIRLGITLETGNQKIFFSHNFFIFPFFSLILFSFLKRVKLFIQLRSHGYLYGITQNFPFRNFLPVYNNITSKVHFILAQNGFTFHHLFTIIFWDFY